MIKHYYRPALLAVTGLSLLLGCQKESARDVGPRDVAPKAATGTQNRPAPPPSDPVDCTLHPELCPPGDGGGGTGDPNNTITFSHTEGLAPYSGTENPTGGIVDVRVVTDRNDVPDGYTLLNKNLNEGCSGGIFSTTEIYVIFTRDPYKRRTLYRRENGWPPEDGLPIAHFNSPITSISSFISSGGYGSVPGTWAAIDSYPHNPYSFGYDLNSGVGGEDVRGGYMRASQTNSPSIEIGVLRGHGNPNPVVPTNWNRTGVNLNEGTNGDYIYFCWKFK